MVRHRRAPRRAAGTLGCLLSLLLFAVALYHGINSGQVSLRYYQLLDGMRTQGHLAPGLHDDVIHRRLNAQADSLLTGGSPRFKITRGGRPSRIVIQGEYADQVDLPLFKRTFVLRARAVETL